MDNGFTLEEIDLLVSLVYRRITDHTIANEEFATLKSIGAKLEKLFYQG